MARNSRTVLVTGGAGYVGALLVGRLLREGWRVRVLDWYLFGEESLAAVRGHSRLEEFKGDIRNLPLVETLLSGADAVIHLACVSNDPSVELDPALGRSVNYECFRPFVRASRQKGASRFLFASSSGVYGVDLAENVTEDHPHRPITDYNRWKSLCEAILWEEATADFVPVSVRPATLCGVSPRMRLDLAVNILTNQAVNLGRITVFGGTQMRPNLHVEDMVDLYLLLLEAPEKKIARQAFNAGFRNHTLLALAEIVRETVARKIPAHGPVQIIATPSDDIRSYHISSEKLERELGFVPRRTLEQAVGEMTDAFLEGRIPDPLGNSHYHNAKALSAFLSNHALQSSVSSLKGDSALFL